MRERKSHPHHGGEQRAVAARAEEPDRRQRDVLRHRIDTGEGMPLRKSALLEQDELLEALQEIVPEIVGIVLSAPQRE